ncbi:MAG: AlkZ family DNA glycosylase [Candidatus Heimdallarchaeota archaeon]|nr:AlkZ family DNA glycosylase [Candidatus Heimdallarchaeota archaeon]MCK4770389.1 AlkZ family DNA glycosylase [Candidatus Heimdallarchaeota archaeon]
MDTFTVETVNQFIIAKQHLTPETKTNNLVQIADNLVGLHSTSQSSPYLSLFARTNSFQKKDLDREAYEKKNLGKIRCMRKTVFIISKEVLPFLYAATKKQYAQRLEGYLERLGMVLDKYHDIAKEIEKVIKGRAMSVSDLKKELDTKENVSAVVSLLCDQKRLIRNKPIKGWRDKRHTYSLFDEYFPEIKLEDLFEEEGIEFLVRYYIERYGPVTEKDIVWWSGLNKTPVRKVLSQIEDMITKISIEGISHEYLITQDDKEKLRDITSEKTPIITFLPDLDPYLMGYKDRERYVDQEYYNHLFDQSGNAATSILLDGRVIGIWDFVSAQESVVKIHLFEKQKEDIQKKIIEEAKRVGSFAFDEEAQIKECKEMEPLKGRIPGAVLVPLKDC